MIHRRSIAIVLVTGLVAGAFLTAPAEAKKRKKPRRIERTAEGTYAGPTLFAHGTCATTGAIGCVVLPTRRGEAYVSAAATDQNGLPVFVSVQGDSDGDGFDEFYGTFCGETTEPIEVPETTELHFWVGWQLDIPLRFVECEPPFGLATTGSIKATFSNLP